MTDVDGGAARGRALLAVVEARVRQTGFRTRVVAVAVLVFAALVALSLHGSSIALSAAQWAPARAAHHYLASPFLDRLPPARARALSEWLMARPRPIRADEWANETMWSLAQFSHEPRFPVVNTNIGLGQNMLVLPRAPVLHVMALCRPTTWGYLLLGAQAGLAWNWWSQILLGFLGLFFLFQTLWPARPWLAVLGAAWFCGSAYTVCWSLWPACMIAFPAFACVAAHQLLLARTRARALWFGAALGWSLVAFAGQLYPPWMVPLAYVFAVVFVGLCARDRVHRCWQAAIALPAIAVALGFSAVMLLAFWSSTHEALNAMAASVYPGHRRLAGGDCSLARLFGGFYNAITAHAAFAGLENESEASGFFLLFPAALVAASVSKRTRHALGFTGIALLVFLVAYVAYGALGVPPWLASATLWSRGQAFRGQIAVGLASIIVSLQLLATAPADLDRRTRIVGAVTFVVCAAFYLFTGVRLQTLAHVFTTRVSVPPEIVVVSLASALACLLLVWGRARVFALALGIALIITSATFNPISRGFPSIENSDLRRAIKPIVDADRRAGRHSLWLSYGGPFHPASGLVASVMGARALGGVYYHPQPALWRVLDPKGQFEALTNRYAVVTLDPAPADDPSVSFSLPFYLFLHVRLSPFAPALQGFDARYVLTQGSVPSLGAPALTEIAGTNDARFHIWEIPVALAP